MKTSSPTTRAALLVLAISAVCWGCREFEGDDPGECADDADNDRDGLFDCDDPECAGAAACQEADTDTDTDTDRPEQIIVVGAGLAGLAAARTLHEHDCCEVTVLEAQDRVGGRVYTIETPVTGHIVEGSAQYHSGQASSSLTPLIEELGIRNEDYGWTHES